ncbi:hypothetical protein P7K49_033404, partial [Saguinus oedipus]
EHLIMLDALSVLITGGYVWRMLHLVGGSQGCCPTTYKTQDGSYRKGWFHPTNHRTVPPQRMV